MENFDDIRPYHDSEVEDILGKLISDKELLDLIARARLPRLQPLCSPLARTVVKSAIRSELRGVFDVRTFQQVVKKYMDRMIESTTSDVSVSGLSQLQPDTNYLFVSNHRDIALDPAFSSYALYHNGHNTARIAIGDNLLSKPYAAHLMRLNKSFIVNRTAIGKQMLAAYKKLSLYIRKSLLEEGESIWIAQREGRAKDSLDKTEPAIIRMISMSRDRKDEEFSAFIHKLNIVPLAISYEWDPCDVIKAKELSMRTNGEEYEKAEHEDLASIGKGISGFKGAVHVHFGEVLRGDYETPEQVANDIDMQIWQNYVLHPSNLIAHEMKYGQPAALPVGKGNTPYEPERHVDAREKFVARLQQAPEELREMLLDIYANPVISRLKVAS